MKTKLLKFTKLHLTKLLSIFFFILLFSSYLSTFAIGQPYNPGETLDPSCAPGDTNCTVTVGGTPSGSSGQIQFNDGGLFAGTSDLVWDAGTATTHFSVGSGITFTKVNYTPATDVISPSVELTRGDNKGLYNSLLETSFDNTDYTSPLGTEWNSDGWGDLSDVNTRTYTTFTEALSWNVGDNIIGAELVMHDIAEDKYYKFSFSSWTQNNGGGGFSYIRNLITLGNGSENLLTTSSNILIGGSARYLNFGNSTGDSGYGIRDSAGVIQYKDGGGNWIDLAENPINLVNGTSLFSGGVIAAGVSSTSYGSLFLGESAGNTTTGANYSNFLGDSAGENADQARYSNFIGAIAGRTATNAEHSNFFGTNAGTDATNASYSNFIGRRAGMVADDATYSNFIGNMAGSYATNAANSIFIGNSTGFNDPVNNIISGGTSILIGDGSSTGGNTNSLVLGPGATNTMTNQFLISPTYSNFRIRDVDYIMPDAQATGAGQVLTNDGSGTLTWASAGGGGGGSLIGSTSTTGSETWLGTSVANMGSASNAKTVFIGINAGKDATSAGGSNFLGEYAGYNATSAGGSNFLGYSAGASATNATVSNFIGSEAGTYAANASFSNFLGYNAGYGASNASNSNFIGGSAGLSASNASYSNFLGYNAGYDATYASNSIFIGSEAGYNDTVDNTVSGSSILIGDHSSTGGFSNSIVLGPNVTNTMTNQFLISPTYSNFRIRDVDYIMPDAQATGAGQVLTNDGSGNLSWASAGGSSQWTTSSPNIYYNTGNVGIGTISPTAKLTVDGTVTPTGTELITNGTFDTACSGWTLGADASCGSGDVTVTNGSDNQINQTISTTAGSTYLLTFTLSGVSGDSGYYYFDKNGNDNLDSGPFGNGTHTLAFTTDYTGVDEIIYFESNNSTPGGTWTIDNISLKEIPTVTPSLKVIGYNGDTALSIGGDLLGNTAVGLSALYSNTTGSYNTANGGNSLYYNTTGSVNTSNGNYSLYSNTIGVANVANGYSSLYSNTEGSFNTASGNYSLASNTTGAYNTANGSQSLYSNTTGYQNTASGNYSLYSNTTGSDNTANGYNSLYSNTTGGGNTAYGQGSLYYETEGYNNTANGIYSLYNNTTGNNNTAIGMQSLISNTTGNYNIGIGSSAGYSQTAGDNNIIIGANANTPNLTASNQIRIGDTSISYAGVQVAWTITSDQSLKNTIAPTSLGLDFINQLKPVEYLRNGDTSNKKELGLIAQDLRDTLSTYGTDTYGLLQSDDAGILSIRYNDLFSPIIKSIQEMDLRVKGIETISDNSTFTSSLRNWFASATNGIMKLFVKEIETENLCVADQSGAKTCITKAQLDSVLQNIGQQASSSPLAPTEPSPEPTVPTPTPIDEPQPTPTTATEPATSDNPQPTNPTVAPQEPVTVPTDTTTASPEPTTTQTEPIVPPVEVPIE